MNNVERCQHLFSALLRKAATGAVPSEPCIQAAEAGAWCLSEIERLQAKVDYQERVIKAQDNMCGHDASGSYHGTGSAY